MSENQRIAVIMSLYKNDTLEYVSLAIESILEQTYRDFDLYLQFDGPIFQNVEGYINSIQDNRIIIRKRDTNKGLAVSLNELLQIVLPKNYAFIARMDADDIARRDRFQKQIDYLNRNPQIDVLGGAINEIDENGLDRNKVVSYPLTNEECWAFFAKRNPLAHPTVVFRQSFFQKTGCLYPTEYVRNEDTALWLEGFKHGAVMSNLPDVLLNFRVTPSFFSQRRNGKIFAKSQLQLRKKISKELGYGIMSYIYAYATYCVMISPPWIIKAAYRILR